MHSLLTKTMQITSAKNAKTLSPSHMKQCILSESRFDFLKDLVKGLPDMSSPDEEVLAPLLSPSPDTVNSLTTVCTPVLQHLETEDPKEVNSSCDIKNNRRNSNDSKETGNSSITGTTETTKSVSPLHAPEFQISVPASFRISQPNFYTEVNPINLTTHFSDLNATSQLEFTHTDNIDEDYDT